VDDQQRARELEPCPFCGEAVHLLVEHLEGTIIHPAYQVRCDNCGASSGFTDKSCVELWNTRAALRAAPEWQPIETAPEGRLVVVGWLDTEDSHYPENYEFDYLEDGLWAKHEDCAEHAFAVAPPGSKMPKEQPPYQWWMELPPFPAARPQGVKDAT